MPGRATAAARQPCTSTTQESGAKAFTRERPLLPPKILRSTARLRGVRIQRGQGSGLGLNIQLTTSCSARPEMAARHHKRRHDEVGENTTTVPSSSDCVYLLLPRKHGIFPTPAPSPKLGSPKERSYPRAKLARYQKPHYGALGNCRHHYHHHDCHRCRIYQETRKSPWPRLTFHFLMVTHSNIAR